MTTATLPRPKYKFFAPDDPGEVTLQRRRSWTKATTASVLGTITRTQPEKVLKQHWPHDDRAALTLKAATTPMVLADYPGEQPVWDLPVLAPGSAALKLFDASLLIDMTGVATIRVPGLTAQPSV